MNKKISILAVVLVIASIMMFGNMKNPEVKLATDDLPPYIGMSIL